MKYRIKTEFLPGVIVGQECEVIGGCLNVVMDFSWEELNVEAKFRLNEVYAKQHPEIFEPVRWKPKDGVTYWYIQTTGNIARDDFNIIYSPDDDRYKFGNCFETREAAEQARDKIKELLKGLN